MKMHVMLLGVLTAAGFAGVASAEQVTCASNDGKYRECPLDGGGDIVMKTQLSKTDCVKNQTWGETADGVYVKGGCRAIFESMSMNQPQNGVGGYAGSNQVTCASSDGKYHECPVPGDGEIMLKQQLSKSACIKNQTWGETGDGVYVKNGCRGIFTAAGGSSGNASGSQGYDDLIGAKAAGGESELNSRGYKWVGTSTVDNSKVSYWWMPGRKGCIQVTTRDGRYDEIETVGTDVCNN